MQPFDLNQTPLQGACLIEASAGTGKTYTLAGVYLRLVLEQGLLPEQILVVTFTTAATAELRDRIRRRLAGAREALGSGRSEDTLVRAALALGDTEARLRQRIEEALVNFDRAAIFTIHGFCQRVLQEQAFETGSLFDTQLIQDQTGLLQQVADDFWRRQVDRLPTEFVGYLLKRLKGPEALAALAQSRRSPDTQVLPEPSAPDFPRLESFRRQTADICRGWRVGGAAALAKLRSPALNAGTYGSLQAGGQGSDDTGRGSVLANLARGLERFCRTPAPGPPMPQGFELLTRERIARAVRKGQAPPQDPFFDACQALWDTGEQLTAEMDAAVTALKATFLQEAARALETRKAVDNAQFFDDLLVRVDKALEGEGGAELGEALRRRFRVALVDEFQDTDTLQYRIFARLFGTGEQLFFMIGDPKQAIYSFRGADVFTYLQAARSADHRFTLRHNWRSAPRLIQAVNALFASRPDPFRLPHIHFTPAVPGSRPASGAAEDDPFRLWVLDGRPNASSRRGMAKSEALERVSAAVAAEIQRLVGRGGERQPGEVAVLVRTNHQARLVKAHLAAARVAAVIFNAGNVFDSPESLEVERLLAAVAEPAHEGRLRAALATDLMGFDARTLDNPSGENDRILTLMERFVRYHDLWRREGFSAMFRRLLIAEACPARLLALPDGERRLTNVLHLLEILQEESSARDPGMGGLVTWLAERRDRRLGEPEEHQLRLESDAEAVTIVTIHKSKGLEYPVVFCPFNWEALRLDEEALSFHDPAQDFRPVLDLGSPLMEHHRALAREEALAESLRLLYVAVTRARDRCYLVHAWLPSAAGSATAYLLDPHTAPPASADPAGAYPELVQRAAGSITVGALPALQETIPPPPAPMRRTLRARQVRRTLRADWRVTSYSALAARETEAGQEALDLDARPQAHIRPPLPADTEPIGELAGFPAGARAGLFFHDLLEHADFADTGGAALFPWVESRLRAHGFPTHWTSAVVTGLGHVLGAVLPCGRDEALRLCDVPPQDRLAEMEFYHPLKPLSLNPLVDCFRRHLPGAWHGDFTRRLERLALHPLEGALKGYIDLVFRWHSRYYLLDWKSNLLGDRIGHYHLPALETVMARELYVLQYHLYALALDRMLRQRLAGYRYARHFGGVLYVFIRGMRADRPASPGVYWDRPKEALMEELAALLLPETGGRTAPEGP
jgi:exodeoxyribonuclease V beta subunit